MHIRIRNNSISILIFCFASLASSTFALANDNLKVLDISEPAHDGGNALAVTINLSLDSRQNIDAYLRVSHAQGLTVDGSWAPSDHDRLIYFEQNKL